MSAGSIIRCFLDVNMACSHDGLTVLAKKVKIDPSKLAPGEYVVFVNRAKDRVKIYAASNVIAYLRSKGQKIDLSVIQRIPEAFKSSGRLNYDQELARILAPKVARKSGPLQAHRIAKSAGLHS